MRSGFWLIRHPLLKQISFSLEKGSILGMVGPNGAGKTTTLKIGAGILHPDRGCITFYKKPFERKHLTRIGFLPELQYTYPNTTVREWLTFLGSLSGIEPNRLKKKMEEYAALLKFETFFDRKLHSLSKGQIQRVGIAQALQHTPEVLLLDEPMSGLDPYWRNKVQRMLRDYNRNGGSIIFSSHILSDVEELCDYIVLIQSGSVTWQGGMTELQQRISGYQVVCSDICTDLLSPWAADNLSEHLKTGDITFSIPSFRKDDFLKFIVHHQIELKSIKPKFKDLGNIIFDIRKNKADNA